MFRKKMSGYTQKTQDHIVLGAGVFFKNYDIETDTFETAVASGKLIGATKGGGEFSAVPNYIGLEIDDLSENTKGNRIISDWTVTIKANVLEITPENIKLSLGASISETYKDKYIKITGKDSLLSDGDYLDNLTWVGVELGSDEPMIIQVSNALSTEGLSLQPQSKGSMVIALSFVGNYDANSSKPPYDIYIPIIANVHKPVANPSGGEFPSNINVTLTTPTQGAKIYYTLDKSNPTKASTLYNASIAISATKTIKAIAILNDEESALMTEEYTIGQGV